MITYCTALGSNFGGIFVDLRYQLVSRSNIDKFVLRNYCVTALARLPLHLDASNKKKCVVRTGRRGATHTDIPRTTGREWQDVAKEQRETVDSICSVEQASSSL